VLLPGPWRHRFAERIDARGCGVGRPQEFRDPLDGVHMVEQGYQELRFRTEVVGINSLSRDARFLRDPVDRDAVIPAFHEQAPGTIEQPPSGLVALG